MTPQACVTPAPDGSALAVVPVSTGDGVPGNAGIGDESVAMRIMSVAVATNQMTREPGWGSPSVQSATYVHASQGFVDNLGQPGLEAQNAAQAWTMEGTRRSVPTWIQRLGAFFQEVRAQQAFPATWAPSAMGSPATPTTRRPAGSQAPEGGGQGQSSLLSRQQREQFRRMEQRAPLLYGSSPQQHPHEGSSGGSTYEAVQDEVKRQLRGVVDQLEASRREARELAEEVARLRRGNVEAQRGNAEENALPQGPPQEFGGYLRLHGSGPTEGASGLHARGLTREASGLQASCPTLTASGLPASCPTLTASGLQASCPTLTASGLQASCPTLTASGLPASCPTLTASGLPASCPTSGASGLPASCPTSGASGLPASCPTSGASGLPASCPTSGVSGLGARASTSGYKESGYLQERLPRLPEGRATSVPAGGEGEDHLAEEVPMSRSQGPMPQAPEPTDPMARLLMGLGR